MSKSIAEISVLYKRKQKQVNYNSFILKTISKPNEHGEITWRPKFSRQFQLVSIKANYKLNTFVPNCMLSHVTVDN